MYVIYFSNIFCMKKRLQSQTQNLVISAEINVVVIMGGYIMTICSL